MNKTKPAHSNIISSYRHFTCNRFSGLQTRAPTIVTRRSFTGRTSTPRDIAAWKLDDLGIVHLGLDVLVQFLVGEELEELLPVDAIPLGGADHLPGDDDRDLANPLELRVEIATGDLSLIQGVGETSGGRVYHAVRDVRGFAENSRQSDTGENVHVVSLAGGSLDAIDDDRGER